MTTGTLMPDGGFRRVCGCEVTPDGSLRLCGEHCQRIAAHLETSLSSAAPPVARCDNCGGETHQEPDRASGIILCAACAARPDDSRPLTDAEAGKVLSDAGIDPAAATFRIMERALAASLAREEELRRELSEAREALEKVRDMHSPPGHSRCACASCAIVAAALSSAPAAPAPDITSAGVRRGVDAAARILAGNGIDTRGMLHLSPEATEEVGAILGRVQAGLCPGCGHARHAHGECGAGCECIVGPTEPAPAAPPESARELAARRGAPLPSAEEQEDNLVANAGIDPAVPGDACCPVCGCKETRPGTDEWTCECPELDKEEP